MMNAHVPEILKGIIPRGYQLVDQNFGEVSQDFDINAIEFVSALSVFEGGSFADNRELLMDRLRGLGVLNILAIPKLLAHPDKLPLDKFILFPQTLIQEPSGGGRVQILGIIFTGTEFDACITSPNIRLEDDHVFVRIKI